MSAQKSRGEWHFGSGAYDINSGKIEWITLLLAPDDGGYTGGGLPDEFKIAALRLSCDIRDDNDIAVTVVWFEEVVTDPNIAAVKVSVQFDDQTKRDEAWLVGKSPVGTFAQVPHGKHHAYVEDFLNHDTFRLELGFVGDSKLWHEWTLDGLNGWIDEPSDLCRLRE